MKTKQFHFFSLIVLLAAALISSLFIPSEASAQRRRVYVERGRDVRVMSLPREHYPVYVGGHGYYYSGGFFYRGGRRGYVITPAPIGARVRMLPVGFVSFRIGPLAYYYYGDTYYQYLPDQNDYVVVQKPDNTPPAVSNDTNDKAVLTDGTTLSGVFVGASADSIQFEVNGEESTIPITKVTSITFAPSILDTTGHK